MPCYIITSLACSFSFAFFIFNKQYEHGLVVHLISINTFFKYLSSLQDEDVYTFFEPDLSTDNNGLPRSKITDGLRSSGERRSSSKLPANKSGSKSSQNKTQRPLPNPEKKAAVNHKSGNVRWPSPDKISWNVLDLKKENYYSCSVGRTRTNARYLLQSSDDVVSFLKELADASSDFE